MNITNKDDRITEPYNVVLDNEIDFDAPYLDFELVENKGDIIIPETDVYDTLYFEDTPILTVNSVSEIEIRFYESTVPNESYRIGQRHIKGRVLEITRVGGDDEQYAGFTLSFDTSTPYKGRISTVRIDAEYIEKTQTRCIAILYYEGGIIADELHINVADWFSSKVYLNASVVTDIDTTTGYPFKVGDVVNMVVYIKDGSIDSNGEFAVIEREYTGRIDNLSMTARSYKQTNENNLEIERIIYYYMITLDISGKYDYHVVNIASTVVKSMELCKIPEIEI